MTQRPLTDFPISISYHLAGILTGLLLLTAPLQAAAPGALAFIDNGAGAWHQAIGGNGVASDNPEFASFWNPALAGLNQGYLLTVEHGEWFAGEMQKDIVELDIPTTTGRAYAINVIRNSVRRIPLSSSLESDGEISAGNRPVIDGQVNSSQWQLGVTAATQLRDGFRLGGTGKFIYESLADLNGWGLGLDLGCWYQRQALTLGLVLRDAVTTRLFWNTGLQETVLPSIDIGGSWRLPISVSALILHATVAHDLNGANYNDSGDEVALEIRTGLAWHYRELFHIGCGWDGSRFSAGTGLKVSQYGLNYALFKQEVLGTTHLVTVTADISRLVHRVTH